jgi:hypothetical protein
MELNKIYLTEIKTKNMNVEDKKYSIARWLWKRKIKRFLKKTPIIQIGLGGTTAAGKTFLIESMLSIFRDRFQPYYLSDNFKSNNKILSRQEEQDMNGIIKYFVNSYSEVYERYIPLMQDVDEKWCKNAQTPPKEKWNENTHYAILQSGKNKCILIFRNTAGEIFPTFYETQQGNEKTIDNYFKIFINTPDFKKQFGKTYRSLYKMNYADILNKDNKKDKVELELTNIKNEFIACLQASGVDTTRHSNIEKYFFEYFSYFISDIKIACMNCMMTPELRQAKEKTINSAIVNADDKNIIMCITQFDKILKENKMPDIEEALKSKSSLKQMLYSMEQFYHKDNNGNSNLFKFVDEDLWNRNQFGNIGDNYYLTSVSYHKIRKIFYCFPSISDFPIEHNQKLLDLLSAEVRQFKKITVDNEQKILICNEEQYTISSKKVSVNGEPKEIFTLHKKDDNKQYYITYSGDIKLFYEKIAISIPSNQWNENNKPNRTPTGVFELIHKILKSQGFMLSNIEDLFTDKNYPQIIKRLG